MTEASKVAKENERFFRNLLKNGVGGTMTTPPYEAHNIIKLARVSGQSDIPPGFTINAKLLKSRSKRDI